jgi:chitinase
MKASTTAKKNVTVVISGMSTGDTALVSLSDAANKYSYVKYAGLANGSQVYKIESGLNLGESVTASSDSYAVNPITNAGIINAATAISAAFVTKPVPANNHVLSVFWCGFGGDFCGQSTTDDVNPKATHVILAFANTNADGSVYVDTAHWPTTLIKNWQAQGKKVIISIGGQNGLWVPIFNNPNNFINSVKSIINTYGLDGVDLDIENYETAPQAVALTINQLRQALGTSKQIIISPEIVGVYQASSVPSATAGGSAWNYFVPVLKDSLSSIDYVQPQFYNNWYGGNGYNPSGASADYIVNGYINWINQVAGMFPTSWAITPIPNFSGVPASKLVIGVLASTSAGGAAYYATPDMIAAAFNTLQQTYQVQPGGIMMWDSNWDKLNGYTISNKAASLLGL